MFETKGAHLSMQRVGRAMLRGFGLTPARFDLLHALGDKGMKQSDLWRRLNVVRSVVSEMVGALLSLGWVERVRATDSRTWLVTLTRRGREIFERAYAACVESGDATLYMDFALTNGHVSVDALHWRNEFVWVCDSVRTQLRGRRGFRGPELYPWNPEDYYFWLTEPGDPPGPIPFVS